MSSESTINTNCHKIAQKLTSLGITIAPTYPGERRALFTDWQNQATKLMSTIDAWMNQGYPLVDGLHVVTPDHNWVCVANRNNVGCAEIDNYAKCLAMGFPPFSEEVFQVDTPGGGLHVPFTHTPETAALNNKHDVYENDDKVEGELIFELKAHGSAWCAPWQKRKDGGAYKPRNSAAPLQVGLSPEQIAWVKVHSEEPSPNHTPVAWEFDEDFDLDEHLAHHGATGLDRDYYDGGSLYVPVEECPACGRGAGGSTARHALCKFIYGGKRRGGYKCHACGIDSLEDLETALEEKDSNWSAWDEPIYAGDAAGDEFDSFTNGIPDEAPALVEKCFSGQGSGCQCGGVHAYPQSAEPEPAAVPAENAGEFALAEGLVKKVATRLIVKRASDYAMLQQKWLWPGIIPESEVTLFAGPVAKGKSLAALTLVACVTTGADWPDGTKNTLGPRSALIGATEDRVETAIKPRLFALGADMNKILFLVKVEDGKASRPFDLKKDIGLLNQALKQNPDIVLAVLDPITGFYGEADGNANKDIRPMMQNVNKVCHEREITFIAIVHENKQKDVGAVNQILGAGALSQVVRGGFRFSNDPDPEFKGGKIMANIKSNLSKEGGGLRFHIEGKDVTVDDGSTTNVPFILWGGLHGLTADDVMGEAADASVERKKMGPTPVKQPETVALIRDFCSKGPRRSPELYEVALAAGISEGTLKKVKQDMHTAKLLEYKKDGDGRWWTRMPEFAGTESQQMWWSGHGPEVTIIEDFDVL